MDMMYLLTLLCTTLNTLITGLFCCLTLKGRHNTLFLLLFSLFVPAFLLFLDFSGIAGIADGHPLRTIVALLENLFLLHLFFEDKFAKKLLIFAAGAVLQYLSVCLTAFPLAIVGFFNPLIKNVELTPPFLISQYLAMFCYLVLAFITAKFIRSRLSGGKEGWNLLILFMSVQLFLFLSFPVGLNGTIPQGFLILFVFTAVLCFAADLAIFYLMENINKKAALEESARFYKTQLSMQLALYENYSAYGDTRRQTRQSILLTLSQIQDSLRKGDRLEAEALLAPLPERLEHLRTITYCRNSVVNALLFIKHREMKQFGIHFHFHLHLDNNCFAEKSDLCRILSNLLDNAIEACRDHSGAVIHLTCAPVKKALIIKTENPVFHSVKYRKNGLPVSTKSGRGHGKGLASVREISEKYGGAVLTESRGSIFSVTVTLFPPDQYPVR